MSTDFPDKWTVADQQQWLYRDEDEAGEWCRLLPWEFTIHPWQSHDVATNYEYMLGALGRPKVGLGLFFRFWQPNLPAFVHRATGEILAEVIPMSMSHGALS